MTKVAAQMSVSLDGYYAGPGALTDPRDLAAWMEGPEAPGFFRVTRWVIDAMGWRERQGYAGGERSVDSQIIEETFASAGAYVMGRRMFDGGEIPWGEVPPFRAPVFVVTHRPRQVLHRQGGTSFTFVTDGVERASTWTPSDAPPADSRDHPADVGAPLLATAAYTRTSTRPTASWKRLASAGRHAENCFGILPSTASGGRRGLRRLRWSADVRLSLWRTGYSI